MNAETGSSAAFHMFRGAMVSMWVYVNCRMEGMSNKEAVVATLEAMNEWADNLDLTHFADQALEAQAQNAAGTKAADKLAGMLSSLVSSGVVKTDDSAAKAAFKIGYMGGALFLGSRLEDSDDDDAQ
jgi:hypothetical protein